MAKTLDHEENLRRIVKEVVHEYMEEKERRERVEVMSIQEAKVRMMEQQIFDDLYRGEDG